MDARTVFYIILSLPALCALVALSKKLSTDVIHWVNRVTATIVTAAIIYLGIIYDGNYAYSTEYFYLDALSMWMLIIITILYFSMAWIGKSYLEREHSSRGYLSKSPDLIGRYYALSQAFVWCMYLVLIVKNLGLMWVAIEATTLISALLVSFKFNRTALEAAWKYVMVCTVGICFAFIGTLILYYAQTTAIGSLHALNWVYLYENAASLDPALAKLAFCFLFVGYGTKIGLAPMHSWLPDAYSEAPSLTSGMLSGALCTCAIYVFLRNVVIVMPSVGLEFITQLSLTFAILTVAVAVPFVVVQRDIKRMLAYSSLENIGLMVAGIGLFTTLSLKATLLHMFNHALIKFVLFYIAGTIIQEYRTKNMMRIHGMVAQVPHTSTFWLLGIIGILGMPPLGLFFSKFYILESFFKSGYNLAGAIVIVLLAGVLIGLLYHAVRMLCGKPRRPAEADLPDSIDTTVLIALLLATCVVSAGLSEIAYMNNLIDNAVKILTGGMPL